MHRPSTERPGAPTGGPAEGTDGGQGGGPGRRFVDLHTHSTASDGTLRPAEVLAAADYVGLAAVALTDHDTTAGLAEAREAAGQFPALLFVPGVEVSARFSTGTMHILGLGIDPAADPMAELTQRLRQARDERNPKIIRKLQTFGVQITLDEVRAIAQERHRRRNSGIISRMHIAETLRRQGYVRDVREAFSRYVGLGAPAYVEKDHLAPREVITAIVDSGGLAFLAHPAHLLCSNRAQLERVVRDLMDAGLRGVEAYHSEHSPEQVREYIDLAGRYGLETVGGSDFHGLCKREVKLGRPRVPIAAVGHALLQRLATPR